MFHSLVIISLLSSKIAIADEAGDAWLARIDQSARVDDAHLVLDVDVTNARGETSQRTIEIWQRGEEERMVRITSPARLRGVGLLVSRDETIHLFLPSYPPARRVVGSRRADAFLGTDFAVDDLSRLSYAGHYEAVLGPREGSLQGLVLTPNQETGDHELHLWVDDQAVLHRIDHIDTEGTVTRRLTMGEFSLISDRPVAHRLVVEDLSRSRRTEARVRTAEVNEGLPNREFSLTELENP